MTSDPTQIDRPAGGERVEPREQPERGDAVQRLLVVIKGIANRKAVRAGVSATRVNPNVSPELRGTRQAGDEFGDFH